ncbi:MAG TPA: chemotaxis protein CheB [Steroidobacteraceae bacterium]|nr:chemotaxis protein CheB [Steroidobacteraceae bacterium]
MTEKENSANDGETDASRANTGIAAPIDFEPQALLPFPVVGVGASAGGVAALEAMFAGVQPGCGMAFVVVMHLSPDHTSMLESIIARQTRLPVHEITDGIAVEPDHVYVIAPGYSLTLAEGKLHLGEPVEKRGHRRPVDDFFRSLAAEQREKSFIVVLSGTGTNGSAGAQAVKAAGGICVAQDPETAGFPGMPASLIQSGYADQVLAPDKIIPLLQRYISFPFNDLTAGTGDQQMRERTQLREVLAILRSRTRHDFNGYRKPTLLRRIQRRMGLMAAESLSEYAAILRHNSDEVGALSNDLMINVTGFFRDPEAWDALRTSVIAPLVTARAESRQPLRAWVTACASGEEPYTLAMIISEEMRGVAHFEVKIFATDTADRSLALARAGVYPAGIEADVNTERLDRFFDKDEHTYRVKKEIRDMVVFAPQDILRDPPFSRVDLATCRNLLIYLEPETQRRVLGLLHFSLRDGGYLFLGNTETYGGNEHLFEIVSKKWRIFRRTGLNRPHVELPSFAARSIDGGARPHDALSLPNTRPSATLLLQRALLERYGPPTVVVDRSDQIVYFHGATEPYLQHPAGEPTRDLMLLLRPALRVATRTALRTAVRENRLVTAQTSAGDGFPVPLEITAAPVIDGNSPEHYLLSFRTIGGVADAESVMANAAEPVADPGAGNEVRMLRMELQSTTEAFEATMEELKAAHEEATSMNEELQSTNEELETSKEELQSVNEELTTVNNQLQAKIGQLEATTNDLANLLSSTDIAVVFLDVDFRVRRFTPAVSDLFEMIDTDIGRPLTDLAQKFGDDRLIADARAVLQRLIPMDREVRSYSGRWYLRRTLPYRTTENRIEGVVITFVDIVARKRAEDEINGARERLQAVLEQMPTAVLITDVPDGRLTYANRRASVMFGHMFPSPLPQGMNLSSYPRMTGSHLAGEAYRAEDWPLERALRSNATVTDEEIRILNANSEPLVLSVSASPVRDAAGKTVAVVGTFLDITLRKLAERDLIETRERFRVLIESARDFAIFQLDLQGNVTSWNTGAEHILGWTEQEIVGKPGEYLFTAEDRQARVPEQEMRQAIDTGRAMDERWHTRKDGTRFWASGVMSVAVARDGNVTGFVKIMRDVTDHKLTEDRLKAAMIAAEQAQSIATQANRAKDEFISVVSHELRTPLNTIRLWSRMLRNEKLTAKDRSDGTEMIERAAIAQQQVIDDLFDVSRITSGKLRLAPRETRLADAIRGAVEAVEPVATARGIQLGADIAANIGLVRADPGRIQQVVWNLLSNAVKFTPSGGRVSIHARREADGISIAVSDTGIGIRQEFLPRVFDRFRQAEVGTTRAHGGLGLGLSIAKQLVELHGGTIAVGSEGEGKGTTFTVKLPLQQVALDDNEMPHDETPTDGGAVEADFNGVEILLVEDETLTRNTMCRLLEGRNARVRAVDSVSAARDALATRKPQLLVSDIGLPGEDGYALIRYLRSLESHKDIPAVAVTAFARPEDRRNALEAGFDEHLAKPVDAEKLIAIAVRLLHR